MPLPFALFEYKSIWNVHSARESVRGFVVTGALQGKKKKKKKTASVSALDDSSPCTAPRVGLDATTISVRRQIQEARVSAAVCSPKKPLHTSVLKSCSSRRFLQYLLGMFVLSSTLLCITRMLSLRIVKAVVHVCGVGDTDTNGTMQAKRELDKQQRRIPERRHSNPKRSASASEDRKRDQVADQRREQQRLLDDIYLKSLRKKTLFWADVHRNNMSSVYATLNTENAPVVIVDGYNVLFLMHTQQAYGSKGGALRAQQQAQTKEMQRYKQEGLMYEAPQHESSSISSDQLEEMRRTVEEKVFAYAARESFQAQVVWDAVGRAGEVADLTIERQDAWSSVSFTAGMEADARLGPLAREYIRQGARFAQVVTSDVEAGTSAISADDSVVLCSSETFIQDMQSSAEEDSFELDVLNAAPSGSMGVINVEALFRDASDNPQKQLQLLAVLGISPDCRDRIMHRQRNRQRKAGGGDTDK